MKQKRTSGSGLFDKLLVPRIENYGTNNDITDTGAAAGSPLATLGPLSQLRLVWCGCSPLLCSQCEPDPDPAVGADAVCEYLRRNYREYTRTKLPVFRQQVERAVEAIARKGGVTKAELRLQVGAGLRWLGRPAGLRLCSVQPCPCCCHRCHLRCCTTASHCALHGLQAAERQHTSGRSRAARTTAGGGSDSDTSSGSGSGSDSEGSSELELDSGAAVLTGEGQATPGTGMNRSMMSLYGTAPKADSAGAAPEAAAGGEAGNGEAHAFAPPHVIAAAAARAAKEAAAVQQQKSGAGRQQGADASASMEVCSQGEAAAAAAGQQAARPASASGRQQQQEQQADAAPSTSGRPAPGTAVKNKRGGGTTPAERCAWGTGAEGLRLMLVCAVSSRCMAVAFLCYAECTMQSIYEHWPTCPAIVLQSGHQQAGTHCGWRAGRRRRGLHPHSPQARHVRRPGRH